MNKSLSLWAIKNGNGKAISFASKMKLLQPYQADVIRNLTEIDVIQFIKVKENAVWASSEAKGHHKLPVTRPEHFSAVGIRIEFDFKFQNVEFVEINSPVKGYGKKMVDAVLSSLPLAWHPTVVFDQSDGFWEKMKAHYSNVEWLEI